MACISNLVKNIGLNCEAAIGGASAVYLLPFEKFDKTKTITALNDPVNTIKNKLILPTLEAKTAQDLWVRIDCPNGVVNATSNVTKNEVNRTSSFVQTAIFNLYFNEMSSITTDVEFKSFLDSLSNGKFIAVVRLASGKGLVIGFDNGCVVTSQALATGVAGADLAGSVITLTASNEFSNPYFVIPDFFEENKFVADTI